MYGDWGIGLYPFCFFFFFHAFFFYESQALHRQLCSGICYFLVTLLVVHMLFFGVFASNYALFWGVKLKKMLSTGNYSTLWSFPAFTAVLCSTHVCTDLCVYACLKKHLNRLMFAVCDKWVDFRGGDAVQQCNALLMFYV